MVAETRLSPPLNARGKPEHVRRLRKLEAPADPCARPKICRLRLHLTDRRSGHTLVKRRRRRRKTRYRSCRTIRGRVFPQKSFDRKTEPIFRLTAPNQSHASLPQENFAARV